MSIADRQIKGIVPPTRTEDIIPVMRRFAEAILILNARSLVPDAKADESETTLIALFRRMTTGQREQLAQYLAEILRSPDGSIGISAKQNRIDLTAKNSGGGGGGNAEVPAAGIVLSDGNQLTSKGIGTGYLYGNNGELDFQTVQPGILYGDRDFIFSKEIPQEKCVLCSSNGTLQWIPYKEYESECEEE